MELAATTVHVPEMTVAKTTTCIELRRSSRVIEVCSPDAIEPEHETENETELCSSAYGAYSSTRLLLRSDEVQLDRPMTP